MQHIWRTDVMTDSGSKEFQIDLVLTDEGKYEATVIGKDGQETVVTIEVAHLDSLRRALDNLAHI